MVGLKRFKAREKVPAMDVAEFGPSTFAELSHEVAFPFGQ
jgi:hypothetical protein